MTISSSLVAGVSGLLANATRLSTISDNIANSQTIGYKRIEAEFGSLVLNSGSTGYTAGGVRAGTQRVIDEAGSLTSTSNATDLAVSGRGMLPVANAAEFLGSDGDAEMLLSTTGSFRINSDGYLQDTNGYFLMGWRANNDGSVPNFPRDSSDGLEPVQFSLNLTGDPTTSVTMSLNLPATDTIENASGDPYFLSVEYFDNLGISRSLDMTFTPTVPATGASNEWTLSIADSAQSGATIAEYVITFDDSSSAGGKIQSVTTTSGGAYDPTTGTAIVTTASGPIEIDLGAPADTNGLSQLSDSFAPISIVKDGSEVGNMIAVEVDENGFVQARFDTGVTQVVYQVPLVDMPSVNGLVALDNQKYRISPDSGPFFLWDAGDGPTGEIKSFALEESTTDVAAELTEMIQTQRAYSSNAKVIQTVDEMLQETTNIKR